MAFRAILVRKNNSGQQSEIVLFNEADLMDGDVTIAIDYSTVNFKDCLAITGAAPIIKFFPLIPGIDLAGTVEISSHKSFKAGDKVVLNG